MNATSNFSATRTADSTDRTAALTTSSQSNRNGQPKPASVRVGGTARRLLNALMRSLATPHI